METNDVCENADYNYFNIWMDDFDAELCKITKRTRIKRERERAKKEEKKQNLTSDLERKWRATNELKWFHFCVFIACECEKRDLKRLQCSTTFYGWNTRAQYRGLLISERINEINRRSMIKVGNLFRSTQVH